ncbi:DegT/DnrJ/EryC1/StrS family aminotransferase [Pleomorphovibrio marinus]|uniref:DegT/DnrJ/EryC1/StrS family aminotransferase n=1 Tax=Pleomorphovibrio marinus TaxID=2164132 RepID=UPI000E0B21AB|nr:DegT/DnrJ/EryC1/StrS family aminotransferase [Pleomorphovibrio marinus]
MIEFLDLKKENEPYLDSLAAAAREVIQSGRYLFGSRVAAFQQELADFQQIPHVIGVGNGLDALKLILRGYVELGILKPGDEVIVPSNTFIATLLAVSANGLKPVLVDPEFGTFNLSPESVTPHITKRTKAIILVHLYGRICWDGRWKQLADDHGLKILEDNAQAFGALWRDIRSGTLGDASAFSFFPAKNLGALGDAGAVGTHDAALAEIVRSLGNYGSSEAGNYKWRGENSRMDEMQAAFLTIKLKEIDQRNERRRTIAENYLDQIDHPEIILPSRPSEEFRLSHVWHLFTLMTTNREKLIQHLLTQGIRTHIHYPIPPHMQPAYAAYKEEVLPVTEEIHQQTISIPCRPSLHDEEIEQVIRSVNTYPG